MRKFKLAACFFSILPFSVFAKDVVIVTGDNIPPYAIPSKKSGAEVEIFTEAFKAQGMTVSFQYVPLGRVSEIGDDTVNHPEVDGSDRNYTPKHPEYFSDPYIRYEGCIITGADVDKYKDFDSLFGALEKTNKKLIGFQGAHLSFGKDFEAVTLKYKARYEETNIQKTQAVALGKKSGDAVVADVHIIRYNMENDEGLKEYKSVKVGCNIELINNPYKAYFRDKAIREAFNAGLKKIVANKTYEKIIKKYDLFNYTPG